MTDSFRHSAKRTGLAISRHVYRLMCGNLPVASAYGQGSTFTVRLPSIVPEPAIQPAVADTLGNVSLALDLDTRRRLGVVKRQDPHWYTPPRAPRGVLRMKCPPADPSAAGFSMAALGCDSFL